MGPYTLNGETNTVAYFARKYDVAYNRTRQRLRDKWTLEEALDLTPRVKPPGRCRPLTYKRAPRKRIDYLSRPLTQAGLNLMKVVLGQLTGEEYLRAEGYPEAPQGCALPGKAGEFDSDTD